MAGSLDHFIYTTDIPGVGIGEFKTIMLKRDESTARQTGGELATVASTGADQWAISGVDFQKIIPRYALCEGKLTSGKIVRRKFTVFNTNNAVWKNTGSVIAQVETGQATSETVEFKPVFLSGEKRSLVALDIDTGLDDGTNT